MADLKSLADTLVGLTIKEVSELADILKEEHGIEPAAAAVAVAAAPGAGGGDGAAEKTEFDVVLNSAGCLLYTSPSPRDQRGSRMPSSA